MYFHVAIKVRLSTKIGILFFKTYMQVIYSMTVNYTMQCGCVHVLGRHNSGETQISRAPEYQQLTIHFIASCSDL